MSILDKMVAAVTPTESPESRARARSQAQACSSPGDWLSTILDHHRAIEAAFADVGAAEDSSTRLAALKQLSILLIGHSIAEEAAIYPALAQSETTARATKSYSEQSAASLEMGLLEDLPPLSQAFMDKLEHLRSAVAHHVYEEEAKWFIELKRKVPLAAQEKIAQRYHERFSRYVHSDG